MRRPSNNPISLPFGATAAPYTPASPHNGVDMIPGNDPTVYAPFSGKVILAPDNGKDGNGIYMYNGNQEFHGMLHNDRYLVENGAQVTEGQPIAVMGWTGYVVPESPVGTHCHWCVKVNGVFIDPLTLVTEQGDDMSLSREEIQVIYSLTTLGDAAPEDHIAAWLGKNLDDYLQYLQKDPSIQGLQNNYKSGAAGSPTPTVLGQGLYEVKA